MKSTKSKIIIVMCAVLCIMAVGYAAFSTVLTITGTANIASEWKVVFTKIEQVSKTSGVSIKSTPVASGTSATFDVGLTSPGDKIVYKITLANQGTIDAVIKNINASETDSPAIIFTVDGVNVGDELKNKTSKDFTVTIEYDPHVTSQPDKLQKTLSVSIVTEQYVNQSIDPSTPNVNQPTYLRSEILKNNIAQADTNIDFSQTSEATETNGLYLTSTNTEGNQPTYYFRGAVENNYVKFGKDSNGNDILWRIIRINEDGSIRLIAQNSVGTSAFNTNNDDNAHVGYMYGATGQSGSNAYNLTHSNDNPSTIKDYLDDWYVENLKTNYASYLSDAGFCNDRSVATTARLWNSYDTALGYAKNYTVYGAAGRLADLNNWRPLENAQPQFKCPNEEKDLFTTSTSTKGNKKLTNPIGLLTADEVAYAGGAFEDFNWSIYLISDSSTWVMSPAYYDSLFNNTIYMWIVDGSGYVYSDSIVNEIGVRPVINLKSTVELSTDLPSGCTKQNGTASCPYIIKTN